MGSLGFVVLFATSQGTGGSTAHKRELGKGVFGVAQKDTNSPNVLSDRRQPGKVGIRAGTCLR